MQWHIALPAIRGRNAIGKGMVSAGTHFDVSPVEPSLLFWRNPKIFHRCIDIMREASVDLKERILELERTLARERQNAVAIHTKQAERIAELEAENSELKESIESAHRGFC